jgi:serine/threonine-protein kinase SRPK3
MHNLNINHHHLRPKDISLESFRSDEDTFFATLSMFKLAKSLFRRQPWPQLKFPTSGFEVVSDAVTFEEEQLEEFHKGVYCPVNIGDVFASKYQVVGKLGFGVTSTVWLARDLQQVHVRQLRYVY